MENNSLFPFKYRIRKTDEPVEVIAWETAEKGSRSENDWVSYIDADGNEHIKEHLTLEWDLVIDSPFDSMMKNFEPMKLPEFDQWEQRRYELVKEMFLTAYKEDVFLTTCIVSDLVKHADEVIDALKNPKKGL
jgi:hypothetical protein